MYAQMLVITWSTNINADGRPLPARKRFRSSNKACTPHCCMLTLPTASALP